MKYSLSLAVAFVLLLSSCSKTVDIVVKDKAGSPYIGALVYIFADGVPEIEKWVVVDKQRREQQVFEERLVVVGLSVEEAKAKSREQYEAYQQEFPDMAPYGYITNEMWAEQYRLYRQEFDDLIMSGVPSGTTNALGTWSVKLKKGDYFVFIDGSDNLKCYGHLPVYDSSTKVYTLK